MVKRAKVMLTVQLIYLCSINVQTCHANSNYAHLQIIGCMSMNLAKLVSHIIFIFQIKMLIDILKIYYRMQNDNNKLSTNSKIHIVKNKFKAEQTRTF